MPVWRDRRSLARRSRARGSVVRSAPRPGSDEELADTRRVAVVMQRDPIVVRAELPVGQALRVAYACRIRHLLVGERAGLLGVLCVCDLWSQTKQEPVGTFIRVPPITIALDAPARWARTMMVRHEVDCLAVLNGTRVAGVVTRRDMRGSGYVIPERRCAYCGASRHVRPPDSDGPAACHDCRQTIHRPPLRSEGL